MDFIQWIQETYVSLIGVCYIIGYALKKSEINDKWIPLALLAVGSLFGALMATQTDYTLLDGVIQGLLCAGAAVTTNQVVKQVTE